MLKYGDAGYMEENKGPTLHTITFSFLAAAIFIVILRFFCRCCLLRARQTTLSEILIVVSLLVNVASCVLIHFQIQTGMGRHIEYSKARPAMLVDSIKVGLAQNTCYQALNGLIKMSILAQFHQLAPPGMQKRAVVWIAILVFIFTLFTVFAAIFQCIPMHVAWNLETYPKGCWNMMEVNFFTSSMNTFLDAIIFILPVPSLLKLHVTFKRKVTLVLAYGMGLLALACSVIRLRNIVHFNGQGDFTYVASMVPVWGAIECSAGIICASFPYTLPLFRWINGSGWAGACGSHVNHSLRSCHELHQTDNKSRQMNSKGRSDWCQVLSESTEQINKDTVLVSESSEETVGSNKQSSSASYMRQ